MVRIGVVCLIILVCAGQASADSWAQGLFDEQARDFGSVPRGSLLTYPFRVANNSGQTVHISSVRVSCGCTTARALHTTLAPGQETAILAQMDTRRFLGTRSVTIYVQFDQPRFAEVRLVVQAYSRDDLAITPDAIAFGKVKRGAEASASVSVSFYGQPQTRILETTCDSNYIHIEVTEARRDAAEVTYKVNASVRPDAPAGKWFTDVWLKTDTMARVRVPLTVEVEAAVSAGPQVVVLGQVKAGAEAERKIMLRGAKAFRITKISGADAQLQIREDSTEARTVHYLSVTLRPEQPGQLNRHIRVQTDLQATADIEFNAQAQVVP